MSRDKGGSFAPNPDVVEMGLLARSDNSMLCRLSRQVSWAKAMHRYWSEQVNERIRWSPA